MQLGGAGAEERLGGVGDEVGRAYGDRADSEDIREALLWQQEQRREAQNKQGVSGQGTSHEAEEDDFEGEEFQPDMNEEFLDLSGQGIDDLTPLIELVFMKMPFLRELNLSNNVIQAVPIELCRDYLPCLEQINLNNN